MIEHYLTHINRYLQAHTCMGTLLTFLVPFAESLPLIGTIVPGSITMSIIGILVGRGIISMQTTLFLASLGALVGDTVGFFSGKYCNECLRLIWPFKQYPQWLMIGEAFVRKHGGKSILIGRFFGPARSSVPLIAGLLRMSWSRFFFAAIPSVILWTVVYLLPGVLIGVVSLQLRHYVTTTSILLGLVIIVTVWLLFWTIQRSFSFFISVVSDAIDHLWRWLYDHHSSWFLLRIITNLKSPVDHLQLTMVLLTFLSLCFFFILTIIAVTLGPSANFNESLFYFLQSLRSPIIDKPLIIITMLGDTKVIISIVFLFVSALAVKKLWRPVLHLTAVALVTGCFTAILKSLIYSRRPSGFLFFDHSSSFPSGHVSLSLPIFGFIAFLTAQQIPKKWHWIPYTLTTILIILVSYSRVYLGAHWIEDVLASLFLGFAILLSAIISYRRFSSQTFGNWTWLIFLIFAIAIPWGSFSTAKYRVLMYRYTPMWPIRQTTIENWWQNPSSYVPIFRLDRFGHSTQPLNIHWADRLSAIAQTLEQKGWQTMCSSKTDIQTVLGRFVSYKPENHIPLLPCLYRDKPPILFMIKHLPHVTTIIELRLWESGVWFKNSPLPLWIGSINYRFPPKHLVTLLHQSHEIIWFDSEGMNQLVPILSTSQWRKLKIYPFRKSSKMHPIPEWDGTLLLIQSQKRTE